MPRPSSPNLLLAQRLLEIRLKWGWAQTHMAEALGCDQASISFWERGRIHPGKCALTALACLTDRGVHQLTDKDPAWVAPAYPAYYCPVFRGLRLTHPVPEAHAATA